jgi:hypothetical protein
MSLEKYIELINTAQNRTLPQGTAVENHHIMPKSLVTDPEWSKRNNKITVALTPQEHYLAHKLLHEAFPEESCLSRAYRYFRTIAKRNGKTPGPDAYAEEKSVILQKIAEAQIGEQNPNYDSTVYILEEIKSPNKLYIGTQYNLRIALDLCKSHLCRHLRAAIYGIEESGGGLRKSVGGYRAIGTLNDIKLSDATINTYV